MASITLISVSQHLSVFLLVLMVFTTLFLAASDVDVAGVPCTEHHVTIPRQSPCVVRGRVMDRACPSVCQYVLQNIE